MCCIFSLFLKAYCLEAVSNSNNCYIPGGNPKEWKSTCAKFSCSEWEQSLSHCYFLSASQSLPSSLPTSILKATYEILYYLFSFLFFFLFLFSIISLDLCWKTSSTGTCQTGTVRTLINFLMHYLFLNEQWTLNTHILHSTFKQQHNIIM